MVMMMMVVLMMMMVVMMDHEEIMAMLHSHKEKASNKEIEGLDQEGLPEQGQHEEMSMQEDEGSDRDSGGNMDPGSEMSDEGHQPLPEAINLPSLPLLERIKQKLKGKEQALSWKELEETKHRHEPQQYEVFAQLKPMPQGI
ncbi:hypothetical protein EYF80_057826 [Liparis tanakae]|uniref:Uncharacterized protein n=1 Tax=Liparis tanakae TaxID=230148 RepID=A0A4Z2EUF7_9TELE|nr:hypothetical protein EYF80_057826 [Liparis tanakae]